LPPTDEQVSSVKVSRLSIIEGSVGLFDMWTHWLRQI
jgi:hypothetical protein